MFDELSDEPIKIDFQIFKSKPDWGRGGGSRFTEEPGQSESE